jgi:hypothetical protein
MRLGLARRVVLSTGSLSSGTVETFHWLSRGFPPPMVSLLQNSSPRRALGDTGPDSLPRLPEPPVHDALI